MFNNVALDVFIGLIFVFLLYSLMASILQEIISTRFAFRAKVLEKGILRMLEDGKTTKDIAYLDRVEGILHIFNIKSLMKGKTVAPWFYAHPLITYLAEDNWYSKPAYISASNFSKVILDLLKGMNQPESQALQNIHDSITSGTFYKVPLTDPDMANPAVKHLSKLPEFGEEGKVKLNNSTKLFLQSLWQDSGADLAVFQAKLEQWFNDTMERTTGWFKKYLRIVLFFIGFFLAYTFNVDSLAIKRILTVNKDARDNMVKMAIAGYENLNPSNLPVSDTSKLNSTYKMVAAEAEKANNILGLGRPWKDTLNMWEDSLKCADFKNRYTTYEQSAIAVKDSVQSIQTSINETNLLLKNLVTRKNNLKVLSDSLRLADSIRIIDSIDILQKFIAKKNENLTLISAPLKEYTRMKFFKERSEYIKQRTGDHWNLYSPNQAGGWETFFGWMITALAVMLGAPFWFDLLSKLISLRGTGTKIDTGDGNQPVPAKAPAPAGTSTPSPNNNADEEAVG